MPNLDAAIRGFADEFDDEPGPTKARIGKISAYSSGVATVNVDGSTLQAPKNVNYTPTVGDTVLIVLIKGSPVIVCALNGFPTV